MRSILTRRRLSIPVLACALLITACGGSSKKALTVTSGSASTPPPSSPQPSNSVSAAGVGSSAGELNACSLVTQAEASTLVGSTIDSSSPKTIADGQDQCIYSGAQSTVTVIVYQPGSGVSFKMLTAGSGAGTSVSGIGDKAATDGALEIDVQAGKRLVAVLSGNESGRVAIAKAVVAALH